MKGFIFVLRMSVQAAGALNLLYIFDNFALDPDRRELRSGAAVIAMEPQAFDLLVYLIRQREQVVSRDELIEFDLGWSHRVRIGAEHAHQRGA